MEVTSIYVVILRFSLQGALNGSELLGIITLTTTLTRLAHAVAHESAGMAPASSCLALPAQALPSMHVQTVTVCQRSRVLSHLAAELTSLLRFSSDIPNT
jgi:hypothetical protein